MTTAAMRTSYEALKAYQMLYQPKHYDGKFLHARLMLNISRELPQNVTQQEVKQLAWHLQQLLETQIQSSPYAKDDALVKREQALINQMPLSQRVSRTSEALLQRDGSNRSPSRRWAGRRVSWCFHAKAANQSMTAWPACSRQTVTGSTLINKSHRSRRRCFRMMSGCWAALRRRRTVSRPTRGAPALRAGLHPPVGAVPQRYPAQQQRGFVAAHQHRTSAVGQPLAAPAGG